MGSPLTSLCTTRITPIGQGPSLPAVKATIFKSSNGRRTRPGTKGTLTMANSIFRNAFDRVIAARERQAGRYVNGILLGLDDRSEEHTSELQSLMRLSYAVFCLKKKTQPKQQPAHSRKNHNNRK